MVHKGNIIDAFVGIPKENVLNDFIKSGLFVNAMEND
jgi:hypothetical protein